MDRARRQQQADRAYDIQGAVKSTLWGLSLATLGHYTWPMFRRQTLAFKAFLVSSFTIFGLVVGADTALLSHEAEHRRTESHLRHEARIELARQGKVATEPEIAKWMAQREAGEKEFSADKN